HVVDAASPDREQQMGAVARVLAEIGAATVPQILVWNKIDLTAGAPGVERDECDNIVRVRVSARTGAGLDLLRAALAEMAHKLAAPVRDENHQPQPIANHDHRHSDVAQ
ncbi:MAG: GTPase HflX, partial [Rhodocyclaceae bacterium]|nr:GTPase HflX [Rhodocyclaceae bacterium]